MHGAQRGCSRACWRDRCRRGPADRAQAPFLVALACSSRYELRRRGARCLAAAPPREHPDLVAARTRPSPPTTCSSCSAGSASCAPTGSGSATATALRRRDALDARQVHPGRRLDARGAGRGRAPRRRSTTPRVVLATIVLEAGLSAVAGVIVLAGRPAVRLGRSTRHVWPVAAFALLAALLLHPRVFAPLATRLVRVRSAVPRSRRCHGATGIARAARSTASRGWSAGRP